MSSDKNSSDSATQKVNITNEVLDDAAIKQAIEASQPRKSGILKRVFFDFGRKTHWSSARKGFLPHLSNIRSMLSPTCPECGKSILMHDNRIPRSYKGNVNWVCAHPLCEYEIVAPNNFKQLKRLIANTHYPRGQERLASMSNDEIDKLVKNHQFSSYLYLALSMFTGLYVVYMFFKALYPMLVVPGVLLVFYLYMVSINSAYRAWQVRTGLLFLPNAPFLAWFRYAPKKYSLSWYDGKNPLPVETLNKLADRKQHLIDNFNNNDKGAD